MNRILAVFMAITLSFVVIGGVAAQNEDSTAPLGTNADGAYVVANDDGNPVVQGEGEGMIFGDIDTGGAGGEILGDANALLANLPNLNGVVPVHPAHGGTMPVSDGINNAAPPPAPVQGGAAPVDDAAGIPVDGSSETVSTDISMEDGSASSLGAAPAPEPAPLAAPATEGSSCAGYPSWYDAQIAYEEAGGTSSGLVGALDPDADGIACEDSMAV